MAGIITDVASFDATFQTGVMEQIARNISVFEQSGGAIRLIDQRLGGDYSSRAVRRRIANAITKRDPLLTTAVVDLIATSTSDVGVKLKRKFGPVANTRDSFNEMISDAGGSIDALALDYGRVAGEEMMADQIDTALRALATVYGALNVTAAGGPLTTAAMINGLASYGDASGQIITWVMHSAAYYALVTDQAVTTNIDGVSNFNVATGTPVTLNRPVVVVDSPALENGGTYTTLGLTADACRILNSRSMDMAIDTVTGNENLITRIQMEYDYNVEVRGAAWQTAAGANPDDATLATAASWAQTGSDLKHLGGFAITST